MIPSITPDQIVTATRQWLGVPYRHLGRDRFGVDCLGLILVVSWELGQLDRSLDDRNYTRRPNHYRLAEELPRHYLMLPDWRLARPGDLLLMRFYRHLPPSHVSIVTRFEGPDQWWIIHSHSYVAQVVEQRFTTPELAFAAFRMKGVA